MSVTPTDLAQQLLCSYERLGGINHLDGKNLPSKSAITSIVVDLLRLLFPGFFDEQIVHASELKNQLNPLLESVADRLQHEIFKSLEYSRPDSSSESENHVAAREFSVSLLSKLPEIREMLSTDLEAAYNGDPAALSHDEVIVAYPFIEAIAVQRLAHELYLQQIVLIPRIMTEWAHSRSGMDLHPGARIGSHFFVDHCTGTVVGETCQIGNHVKMYHGVTLGAKSTSDVEALRGKKRHPTIEDRVTIYPGATILGGETVVGAGSTVGGNVFLTSSVPPDSLVVLEGLTMRILTKQGRARSLPRPGI